MNFKPKIFIVDDDYTNVLILTEILESCYTVSSCMSGTQALETMQTYRPDVVLLDIMMPDIDGYTVCRRIREDANMGNVKIILISAKAMIMDRLKGYECGADDYITKPFDDVELLAKIRVFLKLKRVEEVDRLKNNILMLFSHETNTPLNGILGFSQMLLDSGELSEKNEAVVRNINECGQQLHSFSRKTLLLCNLKQGMAFNFESLRVERLIDDVVERNSRAAQDKNVRIEVSRSVSQQIEGDAKHLFMVFDSILDNAIKFSPRDGTVKIEVWGEGEESCVRMEDQGPGIEAARLESIFDGFAVADLQHHKRGQGLSLAIARLIVMSHKGSIHVSNLVDNTGSRFLVSLPKVHVEDII